MHLHLMQYADRTSLPERLYPLNFQTFQKLMQTPFKALGLETEESATREPFPVECLPPVMRTMAQSVAVSLSTTVEFTGPAVLGIASAALGPGLQVQALHNLPTPGNLFLLGVARSGSGKSVALRPVQHPLQKIEQELAQQEKAEKAELREELGAEDKPSATRRAEIEDRLRQESALIVTDCTREGLTEKLAFSPGNAIASISAEARGPISNLLGRYSQSGSTDEDFFCLCYSREPVSVVRKGKPDIRIANPMLTLVWLVQEDKWVEVAAQPALTQSGFLARCLLYENIVELPHLPPDRPPEIPPEASTAWEQLVRDLFALREAPLLTRVTKDAWELLRNFENETRDLQNRDRNPWLEPFLSRWTENLTRIAVVLHAAAGENRPSLMPLETVKAAAAIMRWFIAHQERMLAPAIHDRYHARAKKLETIMNTAGGAISLRDLKRRGFDEPECRKLAEMQPQLFSISDGTSSPKGGRRSPMLLSSAAKTARTAETGSIDSSGSSGTCHETGT